MGEYARFLAYGHQLVLVHARLRDMLDELRDGVVPAGELGAHCLAFCSAVTRHHTGEDLTVFPELAARHPELRSFLHDLARDHQVIAGMLARLTELTRGETPGSGTGTGTWTGGPDPGAGGGPGAGGQRTDWPAGVRAELDGLAAVLETHFLGEEKRLAGVLNALDPAVNLTGFEDVADFS
ncbi:hypothetical protein Asp14428_71880 [Actinoplanes sp. NBRC 14428]|nr:hypothetical protein Asp14428_71880 [Actinoplanes sp. NBRC 14428]